MSGYAAEENSN